MVESESLRFAPLHYFREAIAIVTLNEQAMERTAQTNNALLYGFVFLVSGLYLQNRKLSDTAVTVIAVTLVFLAYNGAAHSIMRWLFRATGTYWKLARPLLLASLLSWIAAVPVVGKYPLIARMSFPEIWGVVVWIAVCIKIEGIKRWQAITAGLIAAVPFALLILYAE